MEKREKVDFSTIKKGGQGKKVIVEVRKPIQRYNLDPQHIRRYIQERNIEELRKLSDTFYQISGEYRRLVHYAANLLTFDHLIVPRVDFKTTSNDKIRQGMNVILDYLQKAAIEEISYTIAFSVVKYGVFYGYEVGMANDQIAMLSLPLGYCRTRYRISGVYQVEFDVSYFDTFRTDEERKAMLEGYPKEFQKGYEAYDKEKDPRLRWIELDPLYARAHMFEEQTPLFSSVFLDLLILDEYQELDQIKAKLDLYTLLVQKIPLTKEGELALFMEEIQDLHGNMRQMVSNSHIDVITTPCEVDAINVDSGAKTRVEKDNIEKATNMVYTSAGTPIALFNSGAHTGSIGLNLSVKVDESLMFPLLKQFERWYNNKFAQLYPSIEFGILFPSITNFNRSDRVTEYREMATYGFPTKLLALTALGVRQYDADYLISYENELLNLPEKLVPLSSAHTGGGNIDDKGGRPLSDETDLGDAGIVTRDGEVNKNRAKEGD